MTQATFTHSEASSSSSAIREVLRASGKLGKDVDQLAETDDLYDAGLTSHASVNVMLGLEDALDLEFPDDLLRKSTFASIAAISEALETIEKGSAR